jgi:hypothetical protein
MILFLSLAFFQDSPEFKNIRIEPEYSNLFRANPLLMETPGAKIIETPKGFVLVGVGSTVLKDKSASEKLRVEKVAAMKARAALVGEQKGIQVFEKKTNIEEDTVLNEKGKEKGTSVSQYTQINEETICGAVKGTDIVGRWLSADGEIFYMAVVLKMESVKGKNGMKK